MAKGEPKLWELALGAGPFGIDRGWQATWGAFKVPSPSLPISGDILKLLKKAEHFQWLPLYIQDLFEKVGKNTIRVKTFFS